VTKIPIVPDYNLIAAEFALGRVLAVTQQVGSSRAATQSGSRGGVIRLGLVGCRRP